MMSNESDHADGGSGPMALEYRSPPADSRRFPMRIWLTALLIASLFVGLAGAIYFHRLARERAATIAAMQRALAQSAAFSAAYSRAVSQAHAARMQSAATQPTTSGSRANELP